MPPCKRRAAVMSCLVPCCGVALRAGPKGEGGLDDATGASGAAGGASYKQTSRAFDLSECMAPRARGHGQQVPDNKCCKSGHVGR